MFPQTNGVPLKKTAAIAIKLYHLRAKAHHHHGHNQSREDAKDLSRREWSLLG
jgi:hypothetical protein